MKMKAQFETEVFVSESGYVSIIQSRHNEEDQLIVLSLHQVKLLAAKLNSYAEDDSWWSEEE